MFVRKLLALTGIAAAARAGLRAAAAAVAMAAVTVPALAQDYAQFSDAAIERELATKADAEMLALVPMRDGVGLATNIYRPKDAKGPLPTILWKTPYNELNYNVATSRRALEAVRRGYAFVVQNERGRYFSEGKYEILGRPQTDGYDTLSWIAKQPWSNGKVGTLGCSSSAEWQLALAAQNHPAHAAMVPMAAGAGVGKVGRFWEQGSFYTGGVPRMLPVPWLYTIDNALRVQPPAGIDQPTRARLARYSELGTKKPEVDWKSQVWHLPAADVLKDLGEPAGIFAQQVARKGPADPAWRKGGLYTDNMGWGVPALWFNSWYDLSIGPNMEVFNHARAARTDKEASDNQFVVVGPNTHCAFSKLGPGSKSGDRDLGDTGFDADGAAYAFFDRWVKGDARAFPDKTPAVRYFTMGINRWQQSEQWPPKDAQTVRFYLRSDGRANSLHGNGRLDRAAPPAGESADSFTYDPANPVQTIGGGDCCLTPSGAFDQRAIEARDDVLVYTSEPLATPIEVTGFVEAVLNVSSNVRDTDFAVKLVDVGPDGVAYILGDTILRARYRDGFDAPKPMAAGTVYTLRPTPITTSNTFLPGHRIRIEITSSNFPKFMRNLNTGGDNERESRGVVARNSVHHTADAVSYIDFPVVKR